MSNPYEPPQTNLQGGSPDAGGPDEIFDRGLIGHIRVLAILMMIQGGLEIFVGPPFAGATVALNGGSFITRLGVAITHRDLAIAFCAVGGVRIFAGLRIHRLKGRVLGILSVSTGMLTALGCCCLPTTVALFVYGLIVLLNQPVTQAFQRVKSGESVNSILGIYERRAD